MLLSQLIYTSKADVALKKSDIDAILEVSRINNERNGITGLLLYNQNVFIQCLEGGRGVINATYQKISEDTRHHSPQVTWFCEVHQRDFGAWSMNYVGQGIALRDTFISFGLTNELLLESMTGESMLGLLKTMARLSQS